jgi:hypothetical protein
VQNYKEAGFLTFEIMLTLAVASVLFLGTVALVFGNQSMQTDAQNDAQGILVAQSGMENALAGGFAFTAPADVMSEGFTEHLQMDWLADYAKKITSTASFVSSNKARKTEFNSLVLDSSENLGKDTCALGFTGDWKNPVLRGKIAIGQNNPATGVDANNGKVYVATNGSVAAEPDFYSIDASNLDNPTILKAIDTGPGLNALQVAGDYAFVANSSINGQLEIIKISDPANPVFVQHTKFADAQSGGVGNSIFYRSGKVYIGTPKNDGPEFYIYNVQNPLAPIFLGEFELGTIVNKIYVYGDYAYLATADQKHFRILNISDPGRISEVASFSGAGWASQSGQSLAVLGDHAIFGRAGGLPALGYPELYMLDVSRPGLVTSLNSADVNFSINSIFLRSGLAFLATNKSGGQFQVYNLNDNQFIGYSSLPLTADSTGIDCDGENFFLSLSGDPILQIVSPKY